MDSPANKLYELPALANLLGNWNVRPDRFQQIIERYPQAALGLLWELAARNRVLLSQYEDLSFRSVMARVAKLLLDLSGNNQQPIDHREHSNHESAARTATVPEAFSRSLKFFRDNGQIVCTRTLITIRQPNALAQIA